MYEATDPIRDALYAITCKEPPDYVRGYSTDEVGEDMFSALQDWASVNARPRWATGIGILEAADLLVAEAVSNGNLPPPPQEKASSDTVEIRFGRKVFSWTDLAQLARIIGDTVRVTPRGSIVAVETNLNGWRSIARRLHEAGNLKDGWLPLPNERRAARRALAKVKRVAMKEPT